MHLLANAAHALAPDLMGWVPVISGLAVFALVVGVAFNRQGERPSSSSEQATADAKIDGASVGRDRRDEETGDVQEISEMHARASLQLDAAEYALDRLIADCAAVMLEPVAARSAPKNAPIQMETTETGDDRSLAA